MAKSLDLGVEVDTLLSELSGIAGILNIDVGTDAQELYESLAKRLADRGIELSVSDLKLVTEPLSAIYAIPDHMHALCNMLGDGLVPSNTKAGYLARMLARRVCRMKDNIGAKASLPELGDHHIKFNMGVGSMSQSREGILEILKLEETRYNEMLRKGEAAVRTALKEIPTNAKEVPDEILFRLAEERGLNPEMTVSIAHELGWNDLAVRVGFSADMAARNASMAKAASKSKSNGASIGMPRLPRTSQDFYEDTNAVEFSSEVLHCTEISPSDIDSLALSSEVTGLPKHAVILGNTLFYPEGGGQLGDQGYLLQGEVTARVLDTIVQEGVIMHLTDIPLQIAPVSGKIDWDRRKQLMDHHTAVHIVGGSAREILGPHIWQAGSNKGARYARLDITHHSRLTREQLDEIEELANSVVESNPKVEKLVLERGDADRMFGFSIYQGGPPKNNPIRVIKVGDFDTQACGGTHHDETISIGDIHIIKSSQVQDGVERLQIVAGETARENVRNQARILNEASEILGVSPEDLPRSVSRFFEEWKSQQKQIENLEAEVIRLRAGGGGSAVEKNGVRYVVMEVSGGSKQLMAMLGELTRDQSTPTVAILGSRQSGGYLVAACTEGTIAEEALDAKQLINSISPDISGSGGGRPSLAQAGGKDPDGLDKALDEARNILGI